MWLKYPIIIFLFFVLFLLQNSFLPYFNVVGAVPNLIFILFFILTFFEKPNDYYKEDQSFLLDSKLWRTEGFFTVIIAGFFLDIFSPPTDGFYFGLSMIALLIIYLIIKIIMHFLRDLPAQTGMQDRYLIFYFLSIFLFSFFIYNIYSHLLFSSFNLTLGFNRAMFVDFLYNLIFVYFGFYAYKNFIEKDNSNNQLKLF